MYETITPRQRTLVPFEAYCLAASVTPVHLFGIIAEACVKYSLDASRLIAAANHPDVVKATVANALTPLGEGDRKMLHMHSGFVPVPKNQTVINQFQPGASQTNTQNNTQALIQNSQTNFNPNEVNTIENRMSKITDRYNQRMGIAPTNESEPESVVEAEVLESNGSNESEEDWS